MLFLQLLANLCLSQTKYHDSLVIGSTAIRAAQTEEILWVAGQHDTGYPALQGEEMRLPCHAHTGTDRI